MVNPSTGQRRRGRPPKGTRGDTRQELLDAARRLFAQKGYAATTVREIADEVGIRDSAIYAHFNAKQELLDALIAQSGPELIDRIGFDFGGLSEQPPDEVLPVFFERLVREWGKSKHRELISLLTREGLEDISDTLDHIRDRLRSDFETWVEEGNLRNDLSIDTLLWELITPLAAIRILHMNTHAKPAERRKARKLAKNHVEYFLHIAVPS